MNSVGVRELKQNASAVIRRVEAGEEIQVTVQNRPAAIILPITSHRERVRFLDAKTFNERIKDMPPDTTGWLEEIRSAPYDDDAFRDPWERVS